MPDRQRMAPLTIPVASLPVAEAEKTSTSVPVTAPEQRWPGRVARGNQQQTLNVTLGKVQVPIGNVRGTLPAS